MGKLHLSPLFQLSFGSELQGIPFRIRLTPKGDMSDGKNELSFMDTEGRGSVDLLCEAELPKTVPKVTFKISAGSGEQNMGCRGPVSHNFGLNTVGSLPDEDAIWNFCSGVNPVSESLEILLQIASTSAEGGALDG